MKLRLRNLRSLSRSVLGRWAWQSGGGGATYTPSTGRATEAEDTPQLTAWRQAEDVLDHFIQQKCHQVPKKAPRRTMSLSPGWRLGGSLDSGSGGRVGDSEDEVELFMEKYVLPLQDSSSSICEYDSGHHSFETDSANSNDKISKFQKRKSRSKARGEVRSRLVTIVNINGEVTSFKTVHKKQVRITRSKTMPSQSSQSSLHKNPSKVTVNGTGCWEFKEDF